MRQIIGLCCFIVEESGGHKTDMCSSATSLLGLGLQDFLAKSIRSLTGKRQRIVRSLSFSSGQNSQTEISVKISASKPSLSASTVLILFLVDI